MEAPPQAPPRMGMPWEGGGAVVAQGGRPFTPPLPNAIIALAPMPLSLSHMGRVSPPSGGQPGVSAGPQVLAPNPKEREFFIDNLLVRIHLIIQMSLVDRPCAMGVRILLAPNPATKWSSRVSTLRKSAGYVTKFASITALKLIV